MLNEPAIELLIEKLGTKDKPISRFALCSVVSKRARQIVAAREDNIGGRPLENMENELTVACKEIADGKVVIMKD